MSEIVKPLLLLGAGTFAQEVADLVSETAGWQVAGFVENVRRTDGVTTLDGLPIRWVDDLAALAANHWALGAIGTTRRQPFIEQVATFGIPFATVIHPTAHVSTKSVLGAGVIVSVGAVIAAFARIGQHVVINRGALIGHHLEIGDYVTIGPGANIASSCRIGAGTYIGMSAVIRDHVTIGAHSVVGAGAVVTQDVPDRVMVVGVPAKIVKENMDGL